MPCSLKSAKVDLNLCVPVDLCDFKFEGHYAIISNNCVTKIKQNECN